MLSPAGDLSCLLVDIAIPESGEITSAKDLMACTVQIQDLVLAHLNTAVGRKLLGSVDVLRDCYTGLRSVSPE